MVYYKEKGDANIMLKIPKKFEPCFWDTEFNKLDTEEINITLSPGCIIKAVFLALHGLKTIILLKI